MAWQIGNPSKLHDWLARTEDPVQREAMLAWTTKVVDDRERCAIGRRPGPGIPTWVADVEGTNAFVIFAVSEQYHAVIIERIVDVEPL